MARLSKILEGLELFHVAFFCFGFLALVLLWGVYSLCYPDEKKAPRALQFAANHIYALGFVAVFLLFVAFFLFGK